MILVKGKEEMYYKGKQDSWIKHIDFVILDILVLEITYLIAYALRHGVEAEGIDMPIVYEEVALVLILFTLIEATCTNSYKNILKRKVYEEILSTVKHVVLVMVATILYLFFKQHSFEYSRYVYGMTFALALPVTYLFRQVWKACVKRIMARYNKGKSSLLIITTSDEATDVIESFKKNIGTMYKMNGLAIIDKPMKGETIDGVEVVTDKEDLKEYLCREWVDEAFLNLPPEYEYFAQEMVRTCIVMGITVHKRVMKKFDTPDCVQIVQKMSDYTVVSRSVNMVSFAQLFIKRTMDIVGGLIGLILTAILFIFVAPMIYIKSPGPIFFKQWRVGKNGKKFQIYKFRSMYMDAEERKAELMAQNKIKDGMMFKMENDPRIIGGENGKGIGNFIRNTSIDEFPQFLNVLKGDMSLVGTRPPTVDEWEKYKFHHRKRMAIKPGLTGMWQISGRSDITDFEEVVRLDTEYISNWSLTKDIGIMIKTVKVVLFGKGSY